jgi:hypothetical protein
MVLATEVACVTSLFPRAPEENMGRTYAARYHQFVVEALASEDTGQRLCSAWMLLESVLRMRDAVGDDALWEFLPAGVGQLIESAVEAVMPVVVMFLGDAKKTEPGEVSADPVATPSFEARFAEVLSAPMSGSVADASMCRLALWLRAVCLSVPVHASSDITTAITQMLPTRAASNLRGAATTAAAAAPAGKRKRVQDADSYDFFEEEDSGTETAAAGVNSSGRKRLKKRAASSPSAGSSGSSDAGGRVGPRCALKQSVLLAQIEFLGEQDLCKVTVMALTEQLRRNCGNTCGAADQLQALSRTVESIAGLLPALGTSCPPAVVGALGDLVGKSLFIYYWKFVSLFSREFAFCTWQARVCRQSQRRCGVERKDCTSRCRTMPPCTTFSDRLRGYAWTMRTIHRSTWCSSRTLPCTRTGSRSATLSPP